MATCLVDRHIDIPRYLSEASSTKRDTLLSEITIRAGSREVVFKKHFFVLADERFKESDQSSGDQKLKTADYGIGLMIRERNTAVLKSERR